jgi:HD superfamily phosphohydrolase YqeK
LEQVLPYNYWKTLFSYSDSFISIHTINVLYRVISDPLYKSQFNPQEQNIAKWAALLHDICKRGPPLF